MVRAVEESIDMGSELCESFSDITIDRFHVTDVIQPSGNAGLIGYDRHRDFGSVEATDRLDSAFDKFDSVDRPDIAMVDDDCPVPVEQNARTGLEPENRSSGGILDGADPVLASAVASAPGDASSSELTSPGPPGPPSATTPNKSTTRQN